MFYKPLHVVFGIVLLVAAGMSDDIVIHYRLRFEIQKQKK